jgi:WD40 repeat protein
MAHHLNVLSLQKCIIIKFVQWYVRTSSNLFPVWKWLMHDTYLLNTFFFSYMFASASPDNIKQWKCPDGKFIQNLPGHNAIINCLAVNPEGVLVSGADNGTLHCWDWRTGYNFQRLQVS